MHEEEENCEMKNKKNKCWLSLCALTLCSLCLWHGSFSSAAEPTYWTDVRPLLRRNCTVCHSVRTLKEPDVSGGLALDSYAAVLKGARAPWSLIVPGKPDESELLRRLHLKDAAKRMPLDADPLADEAIALLRRWIAAGAAEGNRPGEGRERQRPEFPKIQELRSLTLPGFAALSQVGYRLCDEIRAAADALLPKPSFRSTPYLELVLPAGPLTPIAAVAFQPRAVHCLASGAYGRVTIWDLKTVTPANVLTKVLGAVNDLKFSPDGKMLAVAGGQPVPPVAICALPHRRLVAYVHPRRPCRCRLLRLV